MSREKQLEKLVVTLEAKVEKYQRDLDKAKKKSRTFAKSAKRDVIDVQQAFAGLSIALATNAIVSATVKQEQAVKQLEQGLISTNRAAGFALNELTAYASELQQVTTFGDEDIIAAQAKLVTFTRITGDEFKRTMAAALDLSTRMEQDLKTSVVQLGKALNDPVAGLSALSRTGIQFSEDQKVLIKSLVETGRVADAQRVILRELDLQFGGSARAARDTFGGALTSLGNAFGDLLESSDGLEDARTSVEKLTKALSDPEVVSGVNKLTSAIVSGFSGAMSLVADVSNAVGFLAEEFAAFVNGPAVDDLVRIDEKIADLKSKIAGIEKWGQNAKYDAKRLAGLKEELSIWQEMYDLEMMRRNASSSSGLIIEVSGKSSKEGRQDDITSTYDSKLKTWEKLMDDYATVAKNASAHVEDSFVGAFESFHASSSRALGQAIVEGESLKGTMEGVAKSFGVDVVSGLIKVGSQMMINKAIGTANTAATVGEAAAAGPAIAASYAPAAAMTSIASFGSSAAMALAAIASVVALTETVSMTGMAHDGIANVPREGTWLLDKGERVLSAKQNKDLTDFMDGGSSAGGVSVTNVFQISAGVEGTVQSEIKKLVPELERLSVASVQKAIGRGGAMARAVGRR